MAETRSTDVVRRRAVGNRDARAKPEAVTAASRSRPSDDDEGPIYVCRVALPVVRLPEDARPIFVMPEARSLADKVDAALRAQLQDDSRVAHVYPVESHPEVDNAMTYRFYEFSPDESDLAEAVSTFQAIRLNSVIHFRVRVPAKNQPKYRSLDDVPADEYLVAWDGISAAVQWEQADARATGSGGHVVFDILTDVGRLSGYPVEVMACSPGCLHKFVHVDFVTFPRVDDVDHFHRGGETPVGFTATTPFARESDARSNLERTYRPLHAVLNAFAETKTLADSVEFFESRARKDSEELLAIAYERASRRRFPNLVGLMADLWHLRGSRRRSRRLVAGIWLALASADSNLGQWRHYSTRFYELTGERRMDEIEDAFDTGRDSFESLDLSLVRDSLKEISTRIEGQALMWATFAGAAAALAGGALAALLT